MSSPHPPPPPSAHRMSRDSLPSLLLLPFPPEPATRVALNAAYRPALEAALLKLKNAFTAQKLIVAVACPLLKGPGPRWKTLSWPQAQSLLAGIYSIMAVICAEHDILTWPSAIPGFVDARVVLVDHSRTRRYGDDFKAAVESNNTAVVDLATFASTYYPWNFIFNADSEVANEIYTLYLKLAEKKQKLLQDQLITVQAGVTLNVPSLEGPPSPTPGTMPHATVCLGGTFDHLHHGHKLLLTAGAYLLDIPEPSSSNTCKYIIGITGDELLKNKKDAEFLESWDDRARHVIHFLASILELSSAGWEKAPAPHIAENDGEFITTFRDNTVTVQCVKIQDPFGPTITQEDIDALVVSAETRSGGKAVNDKRVEQGWKPLEVFEVDVLEAKEITEEVATATENFASKISSTAIRQDLARWTAALQLTGDEK